MKWVALLLKRVTPPVKKVFVNFLAEICEYLLYLGDGAPLCFTFPEKGYSVLPPSVPSMQTPGHAFAQPGIF